MRGVGPAPNQRGFNSEPLWNPAPPGTTSLSLRFREILKLGLKKTSPQTYKISDPSPTREVVMGNEDIHFFFSYLNGIHEDFIYGITSDQ